MAKHSKGSADITVNVIIAVVLIVVIGLAGYAIYDKMSTKISNKAIENGEKEATVEYLAEKQNMTVEDYLAQYGLSGVSGKATQEEMTDKMTVDNYVSFVGTTIDDLKTQYNLDEAPAGDANWGEIRKGFTVKNMVGNSEESLKQFKEIYKLDDSITLDSLWTDVQPKVEESIKKMQEEAANATAAPSTQAPESTEAPAESEATEAPAAE